MSHETTKKSLAQFVWREGQTHHVAWGPYRHVIEIVCSSKGRQKAVFADGQEHDYFGYLRIAGTRHGTAIVPVLPNKKLLMVVEQRPAQGDASVRPHTIQLDGSSIDLFNDCGPWSSLEFPGGGLEPGESVASGALRELVEECEAPPQVVTVYRTTRPSFIFGSDATTSNYLAVAYLTDSAFETFVRNDGGLHILALDPKTVEIYIRSGTIISGQAAIMPWYFYREITTAIAGGTINHLIKSGYITMETTRLK
jgi:8-oxo-dGTP pyrophosphatase MutT (NUDIX family)